MLPEHPTARTLVTGAIVEKLLYVLLLLLPPSAAAVISARVERSGC